MDIKFVLPNIYGCVKLKQPWINIIIYVIIYKIIYYLIKIKILISKENLF